MSLVMSLYLMLFIGAIFGWFVAALMAGSKIQDLDKQIELLQAEVDSLLPKKVANKKRTKFREYTDDELF